LDFWVLLHNLVSFFEVLCEANSAIPQLS
jgi:hypothetical protein